MELMRWDPFREMDSFFDRYRRALGGTEQGGNGAAVAEREWAPVVDIHEDDAEYRITAELPGVKKKDLKVNVEDGVLVLQGERHEESKSEDSRVHRVERFHGRFSRRFSLPENVDEKNVEARFEDGVLTLHLPKSKEAEPKAIEVKVR